jgi:2-polyprenyl-6-methoxyphenol hydroxylase-like FAD-dependent oxidoreductase
MISSRSYDGLIVGGGLAGSTVAIALAQAGRHAALIEKSKEAQHKLCGDFLSPECLPFLRRMGIHPEAMGAETIQALRIVARDVIAEVPLPAPAIFPDQAKTG